MQLNNLIVETRVRSGWAAIDLGILLGRRFWLRSVLLYLVLAIPVFLLTRFTAEAHYLWPYIILWWCKPLFERPILFLLSRELFSEKVGFWQVLARWREWLWPGLGWVLSVRRISVARGMYAPISLLERPKSGNYNARASVLGSQYASESMWLTVVLYHLEGFFAIALLVLLALFFPDHVSISFAFFNEARENSALVDFGTVIMMAVIAPFYTAAGFMLYISRRVELEGWDIEICFRDWMREHKPQADQSRMVPHEVDS
jgi:hypothetical protein